MPEVSTETNTWHVSPSAWLLSREPWVYLLWTRRQRIAISHCRCSEGALPPVHHHVPLVDPHWVRHADGRRTVSAAQYSREAPCTFEHPVVAVL